MPEVLRSALGVGRRGWSPLIKHWVGGEYSLHSPAYAILKPAANSSSVEDTADLIIGYQLDVEAHTQELQSRYSGKVFFHEVFTETLQHEGLVRQLFSSLNITFTNTTRKLLDKRNFNGHATSALKSVPIQAYRVKILKYLLERRRAKLPTPHLPHAR